MELTTDPRLQEIAKEVASALPPLHSKFMGGLTGVFFRSCFRSCEGL